MKWNRFGASLALVIMGIAILATPGTAWNNTDLSMLAGLMWIAIGIALCATSFDLV